MIQATSDIYRFHLGRSSYVRISMLGALMLVSLLTCALIALLLSSALLPTYDHSFTLYLKWQDALIALLWFCTFLSLAGSIFVVRFLYALHCGYRNGMLTLFKDRSLIVRDLAPENLASIFWMMHSAFWCFVALLGGLLPLMLLRWSAHLPQPALVIITGALIVLGLLGVVISLIAGSFIAIGCIGVISFFRTLGGAHTYSLNSHVLLRIDNVVLTITYPGMPESMLHLDLLNRDDARLLLSLLHEHWMGSGRYTGNPGLGKEIEIALEKIVRSTLVTASTPSLQEINL